MYELYLDAVSASGKIALLRDKKILSQAELYIWWNESSLISQKVFWFLNTQGVQVSQIENIYTVVWPWSFTGIRSICLFVNTLAYIYPKLELTPLSFFDLYDTYPIVKQSSRRDAFVKLKKNTIIQILQMNELEILAQSWWIWYGSMDLSLWSFDTISVHHDYDVWERVYSLSHKKTKFVEPLYIKKPNIC